MIIYNNRIRLIFASIFFISLIRPVFAEKFLCTKSNNVNFRNGPGQQFAIIYKVFKKDYPVKIINTVEGWHAVEDFRGDKMWVSVVNLSSKCGKIVKNGKNAEVKIQPDENSITLMVLEGGFILEKITCYERWCQVSINNKLGWILKENIWGV